MITACLLQLLLYQETNDARYKDEVVGYMAGWLPDGQISYTPCGLAWRDRWGANRYAGMYIAVCCGGVQVWVCVCV